MIDILKKIVKIVEEKKKGFLKKGRYVYDMKFCTMKSCINALSTVLIMTTPR